MVQEHDLVEAMAENVRLTFVKDYGGHNLSRHRAWTSVWVGQPHPHRQIQALALALVSDSWSICQGEQPQAQEELEQSLRALLLRVIVLLWALWVF